VNGDTGTDKLERRRQLTASIIAGQQPEPDARAQLVELLDPDALAALDQAVLELVATTHAGREPAPGFLETLLAEKEKQRRRLRDALLGRTAS
jgi:hypothetical protein